MKQFLAPAACLGLGIIACSTALAASPDYCALYAKEYVKHALATARESSSAQWVQDRAYHKCLNMDDEPLLPPTAYTEPATGAGGPFVEAAETPASVDRDTITGTVVDEEVVKRTAALEAQPPTTTKPAPAKPPAAVVPRKASGSGYAMWSPEWKDWCRKTFPRSFNPKTGTVIRDPKKPRLTMCR